MLFFILRANREPAKVYPVAQLASQEQHVIFGGRLAEYKYYDMAPIIEKVLQIDIK